MNRVVQFWNAKPLFKTANTCSIVWSLQATMGQNQHRNFSFSLQSTSLLHWDQLDLHLSFIETPHTCLASIPTHLRNYFRDYFRNHFAFSVVAALSYCTSLVCFLFLIITLGCLLWCPLCWDSRGHTKTMPKPTRLESS